MAKKKKRKLAEPGELRLDPSRRVTPKFDALSVAAFRAADKDRMGLRVVDDCAEEHIM